MDGRKTALVVAAHGSGVEGIPTAQASRLLSDLGKRTSFDELTMAYHHGSPRFCEVLDTLEAKDVVVVPFMTSNGYFCNEVLPRELAGNRRFAETCVRQTAPLGTDSRVPAVIGKRVRRLLDRFAVSPRDATLAVVGHGTVRHTGSRRSTIELAKGLADLDKSLEVLACFLDDAPAVDDLIEMATRPNLLVVPFLTADGPHAVRDVPARIGMEVDPLDERPFRGTVAGRTVIYDQSVGTYSETVEILATLAEEAL